MQDNLMYVKVMCADFYALRTYAQVDEEGDFLLTTAKKAFTSLQEAQELVKGKSGALDNNGRKTTLAAKPDGARLFADIVEISRSAKLNNPLRKDMANASAKMFSGTGVQ